MESNSFIRDFSLNESEKEIEKKVRPSIFNDFQGQEKIEMCIRDRSLCKHSDFRALQWDFLIQ